MHTRTSNIHALTKQNTAICMCIYTERYYVSKLQPFQLIKVEILYKGKDINESVPDFKRAEPLYDRDRDVFCTWT